jgi:hypothetical protein
MEAATARRGSIARQRRWGPPVSATPSGRRGRGPGGCPDAHRSSSRAAERDGRGKQGRACRRFEEVELAWEAWNGRSKLLKQLMALGASNHSSRHPNSAASFESTTSASICMAPPSVLSMLEQRARSSLEPDLYRRIWTGGEEDSWEEGWEEGVLLEEQLGAKEGLTDGMEEGCNDGELPDADTLDDFVVVRGFVLVSGALPPSSLPTLSSSATSPRSSSTAGPPLAPLPARPAPGRATATGWRRPAPSAT